VIERGEEEAVGGVFFYPERLHPPFFGALPPENGYAPSLSLLIF